MFDLGPIRRSRRPSLTPMIDVVFLLLVFFMLAARFGSEGVIALTPAAGATDWSGPPRLIVFGPDEIRLNGVVTAPDALAGALRPLMDKITDPVLVRPGDGADTQALVRLLDTLRQAGLTNLVLVE